MGDNTLLIIGGLLLIAGGFWYFYLRPRNAIATEFDLHRNEIQKLLNDESSGKLTFDQAYNKAVSMGKQYGEEYKRMHPLI